MKAMVKMIAYTVMLLPGIGALFCLSLYLLALVGIYTLPARETPVLSG